MANPGTIDAGLMESSRILAVDRFDWDPNLDTYRSFSSMGIYFHWKN